jgi:hypothetical protein
LVAKRQRKPDLPVAMPMQCAEELSLAIAMELAFTGTLEVKAPSEIRPRIDEIERSARVVLKAIGAADEIKRSVRVLLNAIDGSNLILDPLLRGHDDALPYEIEGITMLRELLKRTSAFKRMNPRRKGRSRSYLALTGGPSAKELCALMVGMRWKMQRGKWPGQRNPEADRLCEDLWQNAGGEAHGVNRPDPNAVNPPDPYWRRYLKQAKQFLPPHRAGERVRDLLTT